MTVTVYPYQPAIIVGLVSNVGVELGERCVAELDPFVVKVTRHPADFGFKQRLFFFADKPSMCRSYA